VSDGTPGVNGTPEKLPGTRDFDPRGGLAYESDGDARRLA